MAEPSLAREGALVAVGLAFAAMAAIVLAPAHRPREKPEGEVFLGQYGYSFGLSPESAGRVRLRKAYKDRGMIIEMVFLVPLFMDPDTATVMPDSSYGPVGAARLEAGPNSLYPPMPHPELVEAMKAAVAFDLRERRVRHALEDLKGTPLPGFRIVVPGPPRITTTYLIGRKAHYTLVGEKTNSAVRDIVASLREFE